jgi:hypothetical protein
MLFFDVWLASDSRQICILHGYLRGFWLTALEGKFYRSGVSRRKTSLSGEDCSALYR